LWWGLVGVVVCVGWGWGGLLGVCLGVGCAAGSRDVTPSGIFFFGFGVAQFLPPFRCLFPPLFHLRLFSSYLSLFLALSNPTVFPVEPWTPGFGPMSQNKTNLFPPPPLLTALLKVRGPIFFLTTFPTSLLAFSFRL